jgi:hypothetical protein
LGTNSNLKSTCVNLFFLFIRVDLILNTMNAFTIQQLTKNQNKYYHLIF